MGGYAMSYAHSGHGPLDYQPVRYAGSAMTFRGPAADLGAPFVLCLGGSETYGKFVIRPFAEQLSAAIGRPVANLGAMNAGLDLILHDEAIGAALDRADAVVLQITGAQNMTNRFYSVHPRRNDRFLKASTLLQTIYRDVDFTEFHFTRHMLSTLQAMSKDRFRILVDELQAAWLARMTALLGRIAAPVHLLWMSARHPGNALPESGLGSDPLFVTAGMLDRISGGAASLTVCVPEEGEAPASSTRGMFFAAREEAAARVLPGPELHDRAAAALAAVLTT